MQLVLPTAVLYLSLFPDIVNSDNVARVRRVQGTVRGTPVAHSTFMDDVESGQQDAAFWNRELGNNGSHGKGKGKGGSKGGSKSKGGSSKSKGKGGSKGQQRVLAESNFMNEHATEEKEDIDFWNRELGNTGSHSKGKGKGKGGSKGGSSKSKGSKGRMLAETDFMQEQEKEDVEFWDRELGNTGSHSKGKGKGGSKGGSKSKGGSSKSKGSRALRESGFMNKHATEEKEDIDFWNRELGNTGSHSKGKGKGKGGSKGGSSKSKGKGGSKGHRV